jgi:hypothetical protein
MACPPRPDYRCAIDTAHRPVVPAAPRKEVSLMTGFFLADGPWRQSAGAIVVLVGLALFWHGLRGGPKGKRGLLRRQSGTLSRIEGWRRVVFGLTLLGLGAAWIWQSPLLLYLAIAFGFVEGLESSVVISVWRWDRGRRATARTRAGAAHLGTP